MFSNTHHNTFLENIANQATATNSSLPLDPPNEGKTKKTREPFTSQEDEMLKWLVSIYGNKNWRLISSLLPGRSPKQCRDRYSNYLAPGFFKGEWSKEEDLLLIQAYSDNGPKWSVLKTYFPNRSCNAVKNRWTYFLSKQFVGKEFNFQAKNKEKENIIIDNENEKKINSISLQKNDDINFYTHSNEVLAIDLSFQTNDDNLITDSFEEKLNISQPDETFCECFEKSLIGFDSEWI